MAETLQLAFRTKHNLMTIFANEMASFTLACDGCRNADVSFDDFTVLKHYSSEMDCKVGEALAIKKHRPFINKQLFANGASMILNIWT